MAFSQFAGTSIVPTLSRLVLAMAFVTSGYSKLTTDAEFSGTDAAVLRDLGVDLTEVTAAAVSDSGIVPVRFLQDEVAETVERAADEVTDAVDEILQEGDAAVESVEDAVQDVADETAPKIGPGDVAETPEDTGRYLAKRRHMITLLCAKAGWPAPALQSWAATVTELLGGVLLLVGFLTRIWGLGLAIAMGSAIYLVSMNINGVHTTNPLAFARDIPNFNTFYAQAGLFVLAFGLFLTGAGPLSLDRLLFGRRKAGPVTIDSLDPPAA